MVNWGRENKSVQALVGVFRFGGCVQVWWVCSGFGGCV